MAYEVKALNLGGVLDQAITLVKEHFGRLFLLTAVLLLPFTLPTQILTAIAASKAGPPAFSFEQMMRRQMRVQAELQPYSALTFALFIGTLLVVPLVNSALVQGVANAYLGKPVAVGPLILSAFSRIIPFLWTWFLVSLAIGVGFVLCIVPGILAAFWFALATQVVVIEKVSGVQALKRSRALMKGNIGTLFVLGLVMSGINLGLQFGAAFVPQPHLSAIAQSVIGVVIGVFGSAAIVVFYFSCRCRNEHFDLQLLAQEVGSANIAPAEALD